MVSAWPFDELEADAAIFAGLRRGFWGPQTTNISTLYLQNITQQMEKYFDGILQASDDPTESVYVLPDSSRCLHALVDPSTASSYNSCTLD